MMGNRKLVVPENVLAESEGFGDGVDWWDRRWEKAEVNVLGLDQLTQEWGLMTPLSEGRREVQTQTGTTEMSERRRSLTSDERRSLTSDERRSLGIGQWFSYVVHRVSLLSVQGKGSEKSWCLENKR